MLSRIYEDKILFLQKSNDVIFILAENDNNEVVLLTHKNEKICQIGILNLEYKQIKDVSINFSQNLLGVITTLNKLQIYKISSTLQKMKVSPDSINGELLKFNESGKYLCCYNASKINNIWCRTNDDWIRCKIKQSNFLGLLDKFSNNQYYFKKDMDKFEVITPNEKFIFSLDKQNTDQILLNKLSKRREKQENKTKKEDVETVKRFKDSKYVVEASNKESNLIAGVEDRENRIDIWRYENNNYQFLSTLDKHCGIVKSLCFSNDGEMLISGSVTKEIKVWSLHDDNFKVKQTLSEEKNAVIDLKISNDKKSIISIDRDDNLIIWKTHQKMHRSGKKKKKIYIDEFYNYYEIIKFSYPFSLLTINDNSIMITISNQSYLLFDTISNEFKNINEIDSEIEKYQEKRDELINKKIVKPISKDIEVRKAKTDITPHKILETDCEPEEVKTKEDYKINAEILEFRKNIGKLSVPEQKKKIFSPIRRKTTETVDIIVGLDFGTSNTKMVYRRSSTDKVTPIIFKHKLQNFENYFLPSIVAFENNSKLLLGLDAAKYINNNPNKKGIYNFKMLFVSEIDLSLNDNENIKLMKDGFNDQFDNKTLSSFNDKKFRYIVISYLAYAMREARLKIAKELPNRILDISFNICIPVDYADKNIVLNEFQKLLASAEFIERIYYEKHNNFEFIDLVYRNINYDAIHTRVFDIPETVAEVASYTTSASIKKGLHALIDFGAGTTDISIFNIKNPRDKNQKFAFYSSHIINYGFRKVDDLRLLNENVKIKDYLFSLWEKTSEAWSNAYLHKAGTEYWEGDKVQIFISGGGAENEFVPEIFKQPRNWLHYQHLLKKLPTPENYNNKHIPFHRFAVAYGLSNPKPKLRIDDFILPKDAPNDTPKTIYKKDVFKWAEDRVPTKDF